MPFDLGQICATAGLLKLTVCFAGLFPVFFGCSPSPTHEEGFSASIRNAFDVEAGSADSEFTNEYISIVKHDLLPGEKIDLRHGEMHLYALNDQTLKTTDFKGHYTFHVFQAGNGYCLKQGPQLAENTGSERARFLAIKRSMRALPTCVAAPAGPDPVAILSGSARTVLDTDEIKGTALDLKPGQALPASLPTAWIVYPLNSFTFEADTVPEESMQTHLDEGVAYWDLCRPLSGTNRSNVNARFVVFELKPP